MELKTVQLPLNAHWYCVGMRGRQHVLHGARLVVLQLRSQVSLLAPNFVCTVQQGRSSDCDCLQDVPWPFERFTMLLVVSLSIKFVENVFPFFSGNQGLFIPGN